MPPELIAVAVTCLFLGAVTKVVLGFGDVLVAIPLLTLAVGLQTAAPVSMLMAFSVSCFMLIKHWHNVEFNAVWRLLLAAVIGIPLGVWGLKQLPEVWLTTFLGILLIIIGLYYLRRPTLPARNETYWTYLFGFLAGLLGGAYNIAGPPLLIHGTLRRWSPEQFRSNLQGFFIVLDAVIIISHISAGLWTPTVLQLYAFALPAIALSFWVGNRINTHIPVPLFERILYIALVVMGVLLLV